MIVLGLDPGTRETAIVAFNGVTIASHVTMTNETIREYLKDMKAQADTKHERVVLVIEEFESFGMAVGKEVFVTVRWSGRFQEVWEPRPTELLARRWVKQHLCHTARSTDSNIRQALIDRFGVQGTKKEPGKLFGVKGHEWSALAIAVTWFDLHAHEKEQVRPDVRAEF